MDYYRMPYFFLTSNNDYVIGTPRSVAQSDKTFELKFSNFARNYNLQNSLELLSPVSIKSQMKSNHSLMIRDLEEEVASYIITHINDKKKQITSRDYLLNNGILRIFVSNNELRDKVRYSLEEK
ncbi:MAG: hypothetical protein PF569_05075 [Candidatus Woesearchaeota archaeon]|jgi:hypothetical protein|nr:hypothetical protein [Candidatus Woesearchaeota archaeon]